MLDSDGRVATADEKLAFSNCKFFSEGCKKYGFTETPYWIRTEANKIHFLAETVSPTSGRMVWRGTITGG